MTEPISSGKQLYNLLKQAWDEDEKQHVRNVWVKVLGAVPNDTFDMSNKLNHLFQLFKNVRDDIQEINIGNKEQYLKALNKIESVLMNNSLLGVEWKVIRANIGEETLDLIEACGDLITSQAGGFNEISSEELEELQKQIRNLQDEIRNSEIEKKTKLFLINELRKIEDAILNYQIKGSSGLNKVSTEVTGGIVLNWSQMSQTAKEKGKQIIDLALKVSGIISLCEKLPKLLEGAKEVLALLPSANGK